MGRFAGGTGNFQACRIGWSQIGYNGNFPARPSVGSLPGIDKLA